MLVRSKLRLMKTASLQARLGQEREQFYDYGAHGTPYDFCGIMESAIARYVGHAFADQRSVRVMGTRVQEDLTYLHSFYMTREDTAKHENART
jgi:hypothetical protein